MTYNPDVLGPTMVGIGWWFGDRWAETHLEESGGDHGREFGPVDDDAAKLAYRSGLDRRRQKEPQRIPVQAGRR